MSATLSFRPPAWRLVLLALSLTLAAGPAAGADPRALDALLDGALGAHVREGYVDYPALARSVRFNRYVEMLPEVDLSVLVDESDRLAFWINVYNALAIRTVIDGTTPVDALGRLGFFRTTEYVVGGREYDLQDIETLLGEFGDARVYFALTPAAWSAPDLRSGAYRGSELDQQLDQAVRAFVNDKRKNRFLENLQRARLSELFERHIDAFGGSVTALKKWIAPWVAKQELSDALAAGRYEIEYLDWDWSINGRPM